ncbi:hypothetical protein BDZ97DRAFT_1735729 [Flammula alnicola]|nr:hypothetical protein BDZ97DRAFT_1735729 [Flammula alnicola]
MRQNHGNTSTPVLTSATPSVGILSARKFSFASSVSYVASVSSSAAVGDDENSSSINSDDADFDQLSPAPSTAIDPNSEYCEKRKDAIKRTIASMTVGKGAHILQSSALVTQQNPVRCQWTLPRRAQEHADGRSRTEEARISLLNELRQDPTRARYPSGKHLCQRYRRHEPARKGLGDSYDGLSACRKHHWLPQ